MIDVGRAYVIDESQFPIVRFDYHDLLDDEEFEAQLDDVDRLLHAGRPFVMLVVTHHQRMMPLKQVRRQAAHMLDRAHLSRQRVRGVAMVIPSSVIRGVLKVVLSLAPMPVPNAVFEDVESAEAWARQRASLAA